MTGSTSAPGASHLGTRGPSLREPVLAFLAATLLAALFYQVGQRVPIVGDNLHGILAIVFLYMPWWAGRLARRPFDYRAGGLQLGPPGLVGKTLVFVVLVTWPPFVVGFFLLYGVLCRESAFSALQPLWEALAPLCGLWQGTRGAALRFPPDFVLLALTQLLVIAVPEELFFRGYLYQRLEACWPSRRRFLGARIGPALFVTSLLFAFGHVLVDLDVRRLSVFFPGLVFGWMRARTGTIAAGSVYHALCNLLSDVLYQSYFA